MVIVRNLGFTLLMMGALCLLIGLMSMAAPIEKLLQMLLGYYSGEPVWYIACGCAALGAGGLMASAQAE